MREDDELSLCVTLAKARAYRKEQAARRMDPRLREPAELSLCVTPAKARLEDAPTQTLLRRSDEGKVVFSPDSGAHRPGHTARHRSGTALRARDYADASTHAPASTNANPLKRPPCTPNGASFSSSKKPVMQAIHKRLITPPTNNSSINAQQQPTQCKP